MADLACIYEMSMIGEDAKLSDDLLSGLGMDVLFCLMDHLETSHEIAERLGIAVYSTQLYLQRLLKAGVVTETVPCIRNGQVEKHYKLASDDVEIMNHITNLTEKRNTQIKLSAQQFATMTKNAICSAAKYQDKPNKIKSYFMNARKEDMEKFIAELDELFDKYKALEDKDADQTYSLFTVMAPYEA
ncbi:hypothetical protein [Butyrivibrio sp. NC3005]|uniref:hypothetical protein n=1 Tax=Butyrivibrio sp. NC3005 TaxID=1280685 RepID=UPI00041375AD|nr:hypothetical protein [Butyrivibrio sp. NC3005]